MKTRLFLFLLLSFILVSCRDSKLSPIGPSNTGTFSPSDNGAIQDAISKWSPYVVVHPTGEAIDAYRDSLSLMMRAGKLQGVRIGIIKGWGLNDSTIRMVSSLGIEMLGIIDNYYLFDSNIEQDIDQIFAAYPEIHYFQIGNEITTILPKNGPTMNIEAYMAVFKRIYAHVQKNYPDKMLVAESTFGAGTYGAEELETMASLGLTGMSPNKVIIGLNCYTIAAANAYTGVINGPLRQYRVWVTEHGNTDPNLHISAVQNEYPQYRNYLRAERIYWYAMWTGDTGNDTGYGLIRNPSNYPNYWESPLLIALLGKK